MTTEGPRSVAKFASYGALGLVTLVLLSLFVWLTKVFAERGLKHFDRVEEVLAKQERASAATAEAMQQLAQQTKETRRDQAEALNKVLLELRITNRRRQAAREARSDSP